MSDHNNDVPAASRRRATLQPPRYSKRNISDIEQIGLYLVKQKLGEGAFGAVHLGIHLPTEEEVALKFIDKTKITNDYCQKILKREVDIIKQLEHPNIILVLEVIDKDDFMVIVTEKAKIDFLSILVDDGVLSEDETRRYIAQLSLAVQHMHSLNIAHRDLKIENLMRDDYGQLKVIDFGLSNQLNESDDLFQTTCGSLAYSAPELLGQKPYGMSVDVWGIGICLYVMLTASLPFKASNLTELHANILDGNYTIPNHFSLPLKDLLHRVFEFKPKKRISLDELLQHEWLAESVENVNREYEETNTPQDSLIEKTTHFGLGTAEAVLNSIVKKRHNQSYVTYNLLHIRQYRMREMRTREQEERLRGRKLKTASTRNGSPKLLQSSIHARSHSANRAEQIISPLFPTPPSSKKKSQSFRRNNSSIKHATPKKPPSRLVKLKAALTEAMYLADQIALENVLEPKTFSRNNSSDEYCQTSIFLGDVTEADNNNNIDMIFEKGRDSMTVDIPHNMDDDTIYHSPTISDDEDDADCDDDRHLRGGNHYRGRPGAAKQHSTKSRAIKLRTQHVLAINRALYRALMLTESCTIVLTLQQLGWSIKGFKALSIPAEELSVKLEQLIESEIPPALRNEGDDAVRLSASATDLRQIRTSSAGVIQHSTSFFNSASALKGKSNRIRRKPTSTMHESEEVDLTLPALIPSIRPSQSRYSKGHQRASTPKLQIDRAVHHSDPKHQYQRSTHRSISSPITTMEQEKGKGFLSASSAATKMPMKKNSHMGSGSNQQQHLDRPSKLAPLLTYRSRSISPRYGDNRHTSMAFTTTTAIETPVVYSSTHDAVEEMVLPASRTHHGFQNDRVPLNQNSNLRRSSSYSGESLPTHDW
eukprot:m.119454 g.119454  ORF g.119454 m.119454 type:complete len:876 (-) comp9357_c1_seq5:196-2823(-)